MQYLITGTDGTDPEAPARRLAARPAHLRRAERLYKEGSLLYALAALDEAGQMVRSVMVVEVESPEALQAWLAEEPYATQGVWQQIHTERCSVPGFIQVEPRTP